MSTGLTGSDIPAQETGGAFKFWSESEPHLSIWVFRFGDYHMPMVFRDRQSRQSPLVTESRNFFTFEGGAITLYCGQIRSRRRRRPQLRCKKVPSGLGFWSR